MGRPLLAIRAREAAVSLRQEHPDGFPHPDEIQALLEELAVAIERNAAKARRVEDAWENLRGWLPNGRGVRNWTTELNAAVKDLFK